VETVFSNHPYFFANLITFILVHSTARIFLDPARNRSIILSGFINMTAFPFLVFLRNSTPSNRHLAHDTQNSKPLSAPVALPPGNSRLGVGIAIGIGRSLKADCLFEMCDV